MILARLLIYLLDALVRTGEIHSFLIRSPVPASRLVKLVVVLFRFFFLAAAVAYHLARHAIPFRKKSLTRAGPSSFHFQPPRICGLTRSFWPGAPYMPAWASLRPSASSITVRPGKM